MAQSFGIDVTTLADIDVEAGLDLLARPLDWLVAIEDRDRLRADLERSIPELASGELRLVSCKFKRAYVDRGTWTSLCRLTIEDPKLGTREVDVDGTLLLPGAEPPAQGPQTPWGEDGWTCFLPDLRWHLRLAPAESALPALATLSDPERSRPLLERMLRASAGLEDITITSSAPTVMRHKEGRRCAIRYELGYSVDRPAHWPEGVLAKVYEGDEAASTYEAMSALWSSPLRDSTEVAIAEPIAHLRDDHVLVQALVPGHHTLKDRIKTAFSDGVRAGIEELAVPVRRAGRALAELHGSGVEVGPTVTWDDQVAAVRRTNEELAAMVPALARATEPLVARLEVLAAETVAGPLVPTHRSFRPAQVLLDGDAPALIDFDGFCQAEAGLDLSLFRVTLVDLCLRALETERGRTLDRTEQQAAQAQLDDLCAGFLAGYEEVGSVSRSRLALWDALTGTNDLLECWRKIKFEHLDRRMEFLQVTLGRAA